MSQPLHLDHVDQTVPFKDLSFHKKLTLVKEIIFNSLPNIAAYMVTPFFNITNAYFLSKNYGDEVVAGYGLGVVYTGAFVTALIFCFNQAGNVLMAQAYGAKNYRSCGIYFQKSAILLALIIAPLLLTLLFADKIMMTFSIEQNLAELVGVYARVSLPSFIGAAAFDLMKAFITSQKIFSPLIYIQLSNLVLHFFWAKLFIDWLQMGIAGAALCKVIEDWTITIMIYIYIRISNRFTETWFPWARESFNKESLWNQVKFSIPIAAMTYIGWIYFEVMTMLSGTFGAQYVVAHVAIANTSAFCYMLSLGISVTMIAYTANAVGKGAIIEAKNYFYAGMSIIVTIAASLIVLLLSMQNVWAGLWSTDHDTQTYLIQVFVVFCLGSMWTDAINNGELGLLKAVGKQNMASLIVFITLYPIGVPLMIFLTFVLDYKVRGLWLAFGIANFTQVVWSLLKILKIDWKKVLEDSKERLKAEENVELVEMGRSSDLEKSESLLH